MRLLVGPTYHSALVQAILQASKRVFLSAMTVAYDKKTKPIFSAMQTAAQRGVTIYFLFDRYSFYSLHHKKTLLREVKRLQDSGVDCHIVGHKGHPYKGRYHAKISVIDDTVFAFGGINLTAKSFAHHDYMLQIKNHFLADYLETMGHDVAENYDGLVNEQWQLDENSTVLFDAGQPFSSIIYDRACQLAEKASQITFISQMPPSGRLANILRRTNTTYYFNRPWRMPFPANAAQQFDVLRHGLLNQYQGKNFIHAKCLLLQMPSGEKHILTGSNNFSWRSVAFGTREIALHSIDNALHKQFVDFVRRNIA